jgi:ubiquinone/menaquinone biosynthesis C-methylase UbiE
MTNWVLYACVGVPLLMISLHTTIRVIRSFHKFPIPQAFADLIDNPLRRRIQEPEATAIRHGLQPGMTVLEVGPGNGRYTLASSRLLGESGKIVTVDIEPRMIERVRKVARRKGVTNIEAFVASVYDLPFEDRTFDLIYMIAVIGEIPDPERAMGEFQRVLSSRGSLVFSELFMDPDYPRVSTIVKWAKSKGFRLQEKVGNFFHYTLIFHKSSMHVCCLTFPLTFYFSWCNSTR